MPTNKKQKGKNKVASVPAEEERTPMWTMLGPSLLTSIDKPAEATNAILKGTTLVALYFGCGEEKKCQSFVEKLKSFYQVCQKTESKQGKGPVLECVYVSSDSKVEQFEEEYRKMPWASFTAEKDTLAVKTELAKTLVVQAIPHLVILSTSTGKLVAGDGVERIEACQDDTGKYKELLKEWMETEPIEIDEFAKNKSYEKLSLKSFLQTLMVQILICFVLLHVLPYLKSLVKPSLQNGF